MVLRLCYSFPAIPPSPHVDLPASRTLSPFEANFFLRKTLFSEHGTANIRLNSIIHASQWAQVREKLVEFRRKKWCRWCGKPFGIISEHKKISKKFAFWPLLKSGAIQILWGQEPNFGGFISRNIRRITRFHLWDLFSYFEVLCRNPLSDGPHRSIYPGFQTYPFSGKFHFLAPP